MEKVHILLFVSFALLWIAFGGVIPGKNCGTLNPWVRIDKLRTDPAEWENLECIIVKDAKSFDEYEAATKQCNTSITSYLRLLLR